jgi:hypothetical protein
VCVQCRSRRPGRRQRSKFGQPIANGPRSPFVSPAGTAAAGRSWSRAPSPRASLHDAWSRRSATVPPRDRGRVWSACNGRRSGLRSTSDHIGLPHHQHGLPSRWRARRRSRFWVCCHPRPRCLLVRLPFGVGCAPRPVRVGMASTFRWGGGRASLGCPVGRWGVRHPLPARYEGDR